jgi:tRNA (guanine26-N2/guanine27-N2)-dimethyltransferase
MGRKRARRAIIACCYCLPAASLLGGSSSRWHQRHGSLLQRMMSGQENSLVKSSPSTVFFNPAQELNRDLSELMLAIFAEKEAGELLVAEPFAGTGIRSIRYASNIPSISRIVASDWDVTAVEAIENNVRAAGLSSKIEVRHGEAASMLYGARGFKCGQYGAVDIDPYGSPAPVLDSAVQSVRDGGLLMVTATDMQVLAGAQPEIGVARYGSMTGRCGGSHGEMALRTLLFAIESTACRYRRAIEPLLSVSLGHCVRTFVRLHCDPQQAIQTSTRRGYVLQSRECAPVHVVWKMGEPVPLHSCPESGGAMELKGPIYTGQINCSEWIKEALMRYCEVGTEESRPRLKSILMQLHAELADVPLSFNLRSCSAALGLTHCPPRATVARALQSAGYRVSQQHSDPLALKTDATSEVIFDLYRSWVKQNPQNVRECSLSRSILSKEIRTQFTFPAKGATPPGSSASTISPAGYGHLVAPDRGPLPKASRKHQMQAANVVVKAPDASE